MMLDSGAADLDSSEEGGLLFDPSFKVTDNLFNFFFIHFIIELHWGSEYMSSTTMQPTLNASQNWTNSSCYTSV